MPLFAILHIDPQGLHCHSCTLVEAASLTEIAQHILTHPDCWQAVLEYSYPNDDDCRSLRIRIGAENLTPDDLLTLIDQTELDQHFAEMLRIHPVDVQTLDQLQIKTRLLDKNANQIHSNGTPLAEPTPTATTESSPPQVLSADTALQQNIAAQLQQLHDRFAQQIQAVQRQKQKFVEAQADLLDQLRRQLAMDARSLLLTFNFQEYLQLLLEQDIWKYSQLRLQPITSDLSSWLIPTLEFPVQLRNIEIVQMNQADEETVDVNDYIRMTASVGLWQQDLRILTVTIEDENLSYPGAYDMEQQWLNAGQCLKQLIESEPFEFVLSPNLSSAQHSQLIMELTCLLAYVTQLFNLSSSETKRVLSRIET